MTGRDADAIQREIEETRAELAATVDAIADRVSPRRAAVRGATRVRAAVGSVRSTMNGHGGEAMPLPTAEPARTPRPNAGPPRRVRPERVAVAGGLVALLAVLAVLIARSRRNS